jgi:hypothetical protein
MLNFVLYCGASFAAGSAVWDEQTAKTTNTSTSLIATVFAFGTTGLIMRSTIINTDLAINGRACRGNLSTEANPTSIHSATQDPV